MPRFASFRLAAAVALAALSLLAPLEAMAERAAATWTPAEAALSSRTTKVCDRAAERVSTESGVPAPILKALTRTETGTRRAGAFGPWPWTVNMEGEGRWFDSRADALSFVRARQAAGARSFDIGCFQVNHLWHGEAFGSIEEMFDPHANARYAARFLTDLKREFGSWDRAVGAYHSRSSSLACAYRKRFRKMLARVTGETDMAEIVTRPDARMASAPQPAVEPEPRKAFSPGAGGVALTAFRTSGGALISPPAHPLVR